MRLAQFIDENGKRALAVTARGESRLVRGARSTLDLARQAIAEGASFRKLIADRFDWAVSAASFEDVYARVTRPVDRASVA